jgi:hypothetical protein
MSQRARVRQGVLAEFAATYSHVRVFIGVGEIGRSAPGVRGGAEHGRAEIPISRCPRSRSASQLSGQMVPSDSPDSMRRVSAEIQQLLEGSLPLC